jgi:hypothetical protein
MPGRPPGSCNRRRVAGRLLGLRQPSVIPAQAGNPYRPTLHSSRDDGRLWMPACAGMTGMGTCLGLNHTQADRLLCFPNQHHRNSARVTSRVTSAELIPGGAAAASFRPHTKLRERNRNTLSQSSLHKFLTTIIAAVPRSSRHFPLCPACSRGSSNLSRGTLYRLRQPGARMRQPSLPGTVSFVSSQWGERDRTGGLSG